MKLVLLIFLAIPLLCPAEPIKVAYNRFSEQEMAVPDFVRLADAIYRAEGGSKTKFPYGILTQYQHTTPRQACINTCKHCFRDWNHQGDFIAFLGSRYAPFGVANDPKGLNKNWAKNVERLYEKR